MKQIFIIALMLFSTNVFCNPFVETEEFKVGDKITYQTKVGAKSSKYEFTFTEVNSDNVKGITTINNKQMEFESPAHGYLGKEYCLADIMECQWDLPVKLFDKSTDVDSKWTGSTKVKMQNNTVVDEVIDFKAEKIEKIKVPAGEFDSIRVQANGSIKAKIEKGDVYNGTLKMTTWFGVVNKRLILIKREYTNSFKQTFTQELLTLPEIK